MISLKYQYGLEKVLKPSINREETTSKEKTKVMITGKDKLGDTARGRKENVDKMAKK